MHHNSLNRGKKIQAVKVHQTQLLQAGEHVAVGTM